MDWDVALHNTRVLADGGSVPDNITTDRYVRLLKQAGLWDSCVFFADTARGVKKDSNQYVSKVYDLKANADLFQGTGTKQPKYQTDGSLLYDGGDGVVTNPFTVDNPIRNCIVNITIIVWAKCGAINGTTQEIMCRSANTGASRVYEIYFNATGKPTFQLFPEVVLQKIFEVNNITSTDLHCYCLTFNGSVVDGSSQGLMKIYVDGVENAVTKVYNQNIPALKNIDTRIEFGTAFNNIARPLSNGSQTALHQIYNTTFTPEQILWNYNNIRPEGV